MSLTGDAVPAHRPPTESQALGDRTGRAGDRDTVTVLTIYSVLLLLIPSSLVVAPLGAAGSPATLFGLGLLAWWLLTRIVPGLGASGPQPMRRAIGFLVAAMALSYAAAGLRGVDGLEQRGADRGMLTMASLAGAALVAMDGIPSRERLGVLLRRLTMLGAVMGAVGELQNLLKLDIRPLYDGLPGLQFNNTSGFFFDTAVTRVSSTAGHPIEFGVVMVLLLPFALHQALWPPGEHPWRRWVIVAFISLGIPLSVSRSAVVGVAAVALVLLCCWPRLRKKQAFGYLVGALVVMRLIAPGTLGTLKSGFVNFNSDPSVQGRTEDYAQIGRYVSERPFFGRGFGTFLPDRYILLDNQYLGGLIELGLIGMTLLVAALLAAMVCSLTASQRCEDDESYRNLGPAFAAAIAAALCSMVTFDALGFSMFAGLLFLLAGASGAYWRLSFSSRTGSAAAGSVSSSRGDAAVAR